MRNALLSLGAAAVLGLATLAPQTASAIACGGFSLEAASACEGPFDGNDPFPKDLNAFTHILAGIDKDDEENVTSGSDPDTGNPENWFYWLAGPQQNPNDALSGTWYVNPVVWNSYSSLVIVLKAGNEWAAFLLNPEDTTGSWSTRQGLSHASLYGKLPEPGSLVLLGLGLLGIAVARRRASR